MLTRKCQVVTVPEVTSARRSVVYSPGERPIAVILVHGIFDNLQRWWTPSELAEAGLSLPDHKHRVPLFEPAESQLGLFELRSKPMRPMGLAPRLALAGFPVVSYSYQDLFLPIASMGHAVEMLHRVTEWTIAATGAPRVAIVGFSRGGLVARHALRADSVFGSARRFAARVDRLITIASPFRGSRIAEMSGKLPGSVAEIERRLEQLRQAWPTVPIPRVSTLTLLNGMLASVAQLTPDSLEVRQILAEQLPDLPGGHFAVAGDYATFFSCRIPLLGEVRWPPKWDLPELTDGLGDGVVSIASAQDLPSAGQTAVLPVNHFTAAFHSSVHDQVIRWLD